MKLTKKLEAEILKAYNEYWDANLKGDMRTTSYWLHDNFQMIGIGRSEFFDSKKKSDKFYKSTSDQVAGKMELRNRKISISSAGNEILVDEKCDFFVLMDSKWTFYDEGHISTLFTKTRNGWKIIQEHSSMTDDEKSVGEQVNISKIKAENIRLKDAVKRSIIELENKNRELEIEASLEKVRGVAMGMRKPDDLLNICKVLFEELEKLGFSDLRCAIIQIYRDEKSYFYDYDYSTFTGGKISTIPYKGNQTVEAFLKQIRKSRESFAVITVKGKELEEFIEFRNISGQVYDKRILNVKALYYYFYSVGAGNIGISTFSKIDNTRFLLLKRFRNTFDLAYQRFTDISFAEAQAREAQIEAALERVRARSMAMHKSEELAEAATLLFQQVKALGIPQWTCGLCIFEIDDKEFTWYPGGPDGEILQSSRIPLLEHPIFRQFNESRKRGDEIYIYEKSGEVQEDHYRYMLSLPVVGEYLKSRLDAGEEIPPFQIDHLVNFSHGNLVFITYEHFPEMHDIFKRFAKVFEQTYTRFLDLQKAEAQAKQAKIEAALERVRARAMAMHTSAELEEVGYELRVQMGQLAAKELETCAINLYEESENKVIAWGAMRPPNWEDEIVGFNFSFPKKGIFLIEEMISAYRSGEEECLIFLEGEKMAQWLDVLVKEKPEIFAIVDESIHYTDTGQHKAWFSCAFFPGGTLIMITFTAPDNESREILKRFSKVFGLAYRRFADLQKAEAQAREAKIEAALEKVRSRSLAMHKTEELGEVVTVVVEKLREVDIPVNDGVAIVTHIEGSKDQVEWMENPGMSSAMKFFQPYYDHPVLTDYWNAKKEGLDFIAPKYTAEQSRSFFKHIFEHTDYKHTPQEIKDLCLAAESYSYFAALQKNSSIFINDYSGRVLTEKEIEIVKRFAKVFEQAYVRFLDLQKAEAQAREAQIEGALERVRSRTMAMHQTAELQEVIHTVHKELLNLDVSIYGGSFVVINDDIGAELRCWGSGGTADTSEEVLVPDFNMPFCTNLLNGIKNGPAFFTEEFSQKDKKKYFTKLFKQKPWSDLSDEQKKETLSSPGGYTRSVAVSKHTSIFIINHNGKKFTDAENDVLKRFATVFEQTYTRFLDLKKAEAQAREGQIQLALERVRARTMAMHKSDELPETSRILFEQMNELGEPAEQLTIGIVREELNVIEISATLHGDTLKKVYSHSIDEPYMMNKVYKAWKTHQKTLIVELKGEELNAYNQYRNELTHTEMFPTNLGDENRRIVYAAFFSKGMLALGTNESRPPQSLQLLERFASVFDLTYTRFLDLQKAEEQARENQIQLALERVRARTMAMQHSDELSEAANLLFQQVQALGMPTWSAGYCIWDEDKRAITLSMSRPWGDIQPSFRVPLDENPTFIRYLEAHKKGLELYIEEIDGKALEEVYQYLGTLPVVGEQLDSIIAEGHPLPTYEVDHCAYFSNGFLLFITYEQVPEFHGIFKRFANVFDQTYTRFLDLQKAEAQARESQIQLALERVRAKTMAMQKSEDLMEASYVLFQQFTELGEGGDKMSIGIFQEEEAVIELYTTTQHSQRTQVSKIELNSHPVYQKIFSAWKEQKKIYVTELTGEALQSLNQFKLQNPDYHAGAADELPKDKWIVYTAFFSNGLLSYGSSVTRSEEFIRLLQRFASVFNQTYTRFLDLQKAEAQVREAKIEAALEKVRSRSLAMHKAEELGEVATVVFEKLRELDMPVADGVALVTHNEGSKDQVEWMENPGMPSAMKFFQPYYEHPILADYWKAKSEGLDFIAPKYTAQQSRSFFKHIFEHTDYKYTPQEIKDYCLAADTYSYFAAFQKHSSIFINDYSGRTLSEQEIDIVKRFSKVFEQAYVRFLDLQKAEVQALEAIKRASVDRIRAEIASMRTTNDLERITPLVWNELKTLGVPFIRCGVFIMNEERQLIETHLATPDGNAIATFNLPYGLPGKTRLILGNWQKKSVYIDHWKDSDFLDLAHLLVEQKIIKSSDQYLGTVPHGGFYLHCFPFLQGMLYVGNTTHLGDGAIDLIQSVAEAFSTAYARYLDFNKLEAAKKQVDIALNELQITQKQLIQSEKMASLGELTAGIAHEIQNPLNFVNNFSDVNRELVDELQQELKAGKTDDAFSISENIKENEEKIIFHGKRADDIVKNMLLHSRGGSGAKEPTDINAIADEYLRLSFHGMRAREKSFKATMKTDFDSSIGHINIIPQDIGRVMLNLINNAFYAVDEKKKKSPEGYEPTVSVSTKKINGKVEIKVADNGNGIPQKVMDKIFQPFFTTKPAGQGTGLGLSLSYDIIKAHGGELKVETKEGVGSEFVIQLTEA